MTTPQGTIPRSDIRWKYDLAGGSLMDMTYVISSTRYFLDVGTPRQVSVVKARKTREDPRVDSAIEATLLYDLNGRMVESTVYSDMDRAPALGLVPRVWEMPSIEIETEHATIYFYKYVPARSPLSWPRWLTRALSLLGLLCSFMMPHLYHYIQIHDKRTGATHTEKHYAGGPLWGARGEPWWSTYRYQLEAFVDKVRGRAPAHWVTLESSVAQMETIDAIYEMAGLGKRQPTRE